MANAVKTDPNQGRILAAAVKHGYITSGELNTVATTLGDDGLKSMIEAAYPPNERAESAGEPTTALGQKLQGLTESGIDSNKELKQDLDDLLPKMMGVVAERTGGQTARDTLKVVFNALDGIVVDSSAPPTPPQIGDSTTTTTDVPQPPMQASPTGPVLNQDLKDKIVASMSDHMLNPADGIDGYQASKMVPFTSVFGQKLQQVIGAPMDRGVAQKLKDIQDDLAAVKPEEKGRFNIPKVRDFVEEHGLQQFNRYLGDTVRDLFIQNNLDPEQVKHLFVDQSSPNYATSFEKMLNTNLTKAAQRGQQMDPRKKQLLQVTRETCKNQSVYEFNQHVSEILTRS